MSYMPRFFKTGRVWVYCNSCEDDAFVQENIESHSPQAIVERTADPHFILWRTVNKSSAAVGL